MKIEDFKKCLNRHGYKIINDVMPKTVIYHTCKSWDDIHIEYYTLNRLLNTFEQIKSLTELIDFKCEFQSDGGCKRYPSIHHNRGKNMCCCGGCKETVGHFRSMRESRIKQIARLFNNETGFWRKEKGCALPRHLRSRICVNHYCYDVIGLKHMERMHDISSALSTLGTQVQAHIRRMREKNIY